MHKLIGTFNLYSVFNGHHKISLQTHLIKNKINLIKLFNLLDLFGYVNIIYFIVT